jgi:hypothetical protein
VRSSASHRSFAVAASSYKRRYESDRCAAISAFALSSLSASSTNVVLFDALVASLKR